MKNKLFITVFCAILSSAAASAAPTYFNFSNPAGLLGTSQTYTSNGITVTAYGYNGGSLSALFGKNVSVQDTGLGLAAGPNHEIDKFDFIQLDFGMLIAAFPKADVRITMASVDSGDAFNIYGSMAQGSLGNLLLSNSTLNLTAFSVPSYGAYRYVSIQAASANHDVLLRSVQVVPEPATWGLMGLGLAVAAYVRKRQTAR